MKKKASRPASKALTAAPKAPLRRKAAAGKAAALVNESALLADLRSLIQSARQRVAVVANSTTTLLCWHLGQRLLRDNLQDGRAEYGKRILATVSRELTAEFGRGFTLRSLYRAIQFSEFFPDQEIVSTLSTQLSWSHFMELLPVKEPLAREFYAELCRIERWDVRTLRKKIGGLLFQRTALAKKPESVIAAEIGQMREGQLSPDIVFRDPYILDVLGLQGAFSESDLESAILREIEGVLLELGAGFTFVARQKRMSMGRDDFHLDLLFFHRHLRRLIAVELKLESFQPAHVGQMELYLRWLDKHERAAGGPKARIHTSLGQRPRSACVVGMRAESPRHLRADVGNWAGLSALGALVSSHLGRCPRLVWVAPLAHRQTGASAHSLKKIGGL